VVASPPPPAITNPTLRNASPSACNEQLARPMNLWLTKPFRLVSTSYRGGNEQGYPSIFPTFADLIMVLKKKT
jgi:hypothetical protein